MSTALQKNEDILGITDQDIALQAPFQERILEFAVRQNAPIDTIERLVALQEKMASRHAEEQFNQGMNRVQAAMGPVAADLTNPQTKSRYASYGALDKRVRPIYSKEGFSLSFDTGEAGTDEVLVLCYVSHSAGHTRTYRVRMPADGKGAKGGDVMTKTHAAGAAMSYGMRYLLKYIFNIAIGEEDTDGNPSSGRYTNLSEAIEYLNNCRQEDELIRTFQAYYKEARECGDTNAQRALTEAKNARKQAIREGH